ncbi:MAG: asparaginase [Candidatus Eremiobacteraeota bacterium]|nr:asparaginase [Candidatus Eremiobacteraeota bacterium]MBC5804363.1 asparaginase [Candidatus Eremiobacteraeota bacterium]MBC5821374.1 asparaginase [Candidatus Eremiobacteraeota bacterium]
MICGVPFVAVTRGDVVESVHAIAACAADTQGDIALSYGDVDAPVYLRSAAKPFIAAAIVQSGAAAHFGFDARELAVIAASHNGETFHVHAVRGILAKAGLGPQDLRCGAHPPSYEPAAAALAAAGEAPSALHNNCSGKHAGILAMCVHLGLDTATYLEPAHPAQQRILALCARLVGKPLEDLPVGVDGCGIPVFATSLRAAARGFARVATLVDVPDADAQALQTVREAMAAEPAYVGGTARFDSALLAVTGGRIVGKAGAEGVHADALLRSGLGLVVKVIDGGKRAVPPAAIALLSELGAFAPGEAHALAEFARPAVRNVAGRIVGAVEVRADTFQAVAAS